MRPILYRIGYQGETKILTQLSFIHNSVKTILVTPCLKGVTIHPIFCDTHWVIHWVGTFLLFKKKFKVAPPTLYCAL
jgi:hypothetical protein